MADYRPLIARAVEGLGDQTHDARRLLYERARAAIVAQLRGINPPPSETEIARERLALEDAIREVEAESVRKAQAEPRPAAVGPDAIDALGGVASATRMATARRGGAPGSAPLRAAESVSQTAAVCRGAENKYRGAQPHRLSDAYEATWDQAQPPDHERSPDMLKDSAMYGLDQSYELNDEQRIERGPSPVRRSLDDYREPGPPRFYRGLARLIAAALILAGVGSLAYWQWSNSNGLYQFVSDMRSRQSQTSEQSTGEPQSAERVPQEQARPQARAAESKAQSGPVAQRAVLYEGDAGNPPGKEYIGAATWRTETVSSGSGLPPELQIRAEVAVPERNVTVTWLLRRNTDQALPASHTIEIMFDLPKDFPGGGVADVRGVLMKEAENPRGIPLAGLTVKVTNSFYMIGLSAVDADLQQNLQLLKERPWFGIPLIYDNGGRAVLKFEKGSTGRRAFADAFAAWGN
jgi:hypothetical protein